MKNKNHLTKDTCAWSSLTCATGLRDLKWVYYRKWMMRMALSGLLFSLLFSSDINLIPTHTKQPDTSLITRLSSFKKTITLWYFLEGGGGMLSNAAAAQSLPVLSGGADDGVLLCLLSRPSWIDEDTLLSGLSVSLQSHYNVFDCIFPSL